VALLVTAGPVAVLLFCTIKQSNRANITPFSKVQVITGPELAYNL